MQIQWDFPGIVQSFLAPAVVAGAVSFAFHTSAKGKLESYFEHQLEAFKAQLQRDIETHQAELARLADAAKFDYSRRLADFNLFARKRHVVYRELFRQYRVAYDAYNEYGGKFHHTPGYYRKLDETEVAALMTRKHVLAAERKKVLDEWKDDREAGVSSLLSALDPRYRRRARALLDKAQQYWLANSLYMSADINAFVESSLVPTLVEYVRFLEPGISAPQPSDEAFKKGQRAFQTDLKARFRELAAALRRELAAGDYDPNGHRSAVAEELRNVAPA